MVFTMVPQSLLRELIRYFSIVVQWPKSGYCLKYVALKIVSENTGTFSFMAMQSFGTEIHNLVHDLLSRYYYSHYTRSAQKVMNQIARK